MPHRPDPIARFLHGVVSAHDGTLADLGGGIWELQPPAKQPDRFGQGPLRVTTDKEAHHLDPELQLLAPGTPLLQRLVHLVRSGGVSLFKGRYLAAWSEKAARAAVADLLPQRKKPAIEPRRETCLRVLLRARLLRDYVAEELVPVVVAAGGRTWRGGPPLDDADLLVPEPRLSLTWPELKEQVMAAVAAAEAHLLPAILEHEAELADLLRRESDRINAYYDEVEEAEEYAEGLADPAEAAAALAALQAERAKLLGEQQHRCRLQVTLEPVSLALLRVDVLAMPLATGEILFHPLLGEPLLPACGSCERQTALATLTPEPLCPTCLALNGP